MNELESIYAAIADTVYALDEKALIDMQGIQVGDKIEMRIAIKSDAKVCLRSIQKVTKTKIDWKRVPWNSEHFAMIAKKSCESGSDVFESRMPLGSVFYMVEALAFLLAKHRAAATAAPATAMVSLIGEEISVEIEGVKEIEQIKSVIPTDIASVAEVLSLNHPIYTEGLKSKETLCVDLSSPHKNNNLSKRSSCTS